MSAALFIDVQVEESVARDPEIAAKLAEVCPVDIFRAGPGGVEIVQDNLDECVLCQLCLRVAPAGSVKVIKLYDDGAVLGA
jgi:NAD-dependent dihydropyrimidine dehydrogenase PreA subunit